MIDFSKIFASKNNLVVIGGNSFCENLNILKKLISVSDSFGKINLFLNNEIYSVFSLFDYDFIYQDFDLRKIESESIIINYSEKIHNSVFKKINNHIYLSPFGGNFEINKASDNFLDDLVSFLAINKFDFGDLKLSIPEIRKENFEMIIFLKDRIFSPFFPKKLLNIQKNFKKKILFSVNLLFGSSNDEVLISPKSYRDLFILSFKTNLFISDDLDFLKFLHNFGVKIESTVKTENIRYCNLNELAKSD